MDEVSHTSINVNVSAVSEMYRKREKAIKAAAKAMEEQLKAFKEHRGMIRAVLAGVGVRGGEMGLYINFYFP